MRIGCSPLARTRLSYSRKSYDPFISTSSIFAPSSISSLSPLNEKNDHSSSYPGPNTGEPSGVISMNPSLRAVPSGNATHSCTPSSMSARPSVIERSTGSNSNPSWLSHTSSVIPDHPSTVISFPASSDVLYTGGSHSKPYSLSCPSAIKILLCRRHPAYLTVRVGNVKHPGMPFPYSCLYGIVPRTHYFFDSDDGVKKERHPKAPMYGRSIPHKNSVVTSGSRSGSRNTSPRRWTSPDLWMRLRCILSPPCS